MIWRAVADGVAPALLVSPWTALINDCAQAWLWSAMAWRVPRVEAVSMVIRPAAPFVFAAFAAAERAWSCFFCSSVSASAHWSTTKGLEAAVVFRLGSLIGRT